MDWDQYVDSRVKILDGVHPKLASVLISQSENRAYYAGFEECLGILRGLVSEFYEVNELCKMAHIPF